MADGGVIATLVAPRSIAAVCCFRDRDRLLGVLQAEFGVALPTTPRSIRAGAVTLSCLAPRRFLASGDRAAGLPARLAAILVGIAAVTDQSDRWHSVQLDGPAAAETLARLLPIDRDPETFRVGDLALTRAGHVDARLWRVAEYSYELAVTRSHAFGLQHALRVLGAPVHIWGSVGLGVNTTDSVPVQKHPLSTQ